jgi:hypothetical protein
MTEPDMFGDSPDATKPMPLRYSDRQRPRAAWRLVALAAAGLITLVILFDGQTGRSDDIQVRACLEPVYAGLFGTAPHALERCLENRPKLFGARDAQWLRYVKHLEDSCPVATGMQGQAICEFQVKSSEDHAGKGWRTRHD